MALLIPVSTCATSTPLHMCNINSLELLYSLLSGVQVLWPRFRRGQKKWDGGGGRAPKRAFKTDYAAEANRVIFFFLLLLQAVPSCLTVAVSAFISALFVAIAKSVALYAWNWAWLITPGISRCSIRSSASATSIEVCRVTRRSPSRGSRAWRLPLTESSSGDAGAA